MADRQYYHRFFLNWCKSYVSYLCLHQIEFIKTHISHQIATIELCKYTPNQTNLAIPRSQKKFENDFRFKMDFRSIFSEIF